MPVEGNLLYDRLIDMVPQALDKMKEIMHRHGSDEDEFEELAERPNPAQGYQPRL